MLSQIYLKIKPGAFKEHKADALTTEIPALSHGSLQNLLECVKLAFLYYRVPMYNQEGGT